MRALMTKTLFVLSILLSAQALAFDFGGLSYDIINATDVEVTGRASGNTATNIVIPATVVGSGTTYSVTTIGDDAFVYGNALTSVIIPDSVTTIGIEAFDINALTSAAFEGDFGSFDLNMFRNNSTLATITYCDVKTGWPQGFNNGSTIVVTTPIVCLPPGC